MMDLEKGVEIRSNEPRLYVWLIYMWVASSGAFEKRECAVILKNYTTK
jgi:hypothetical protein